MKVTFLYLQENRVVTSIPLHMISKQSLQLHHRGLYVGQWEGMAISIFIGGGVVLLGLLTLLFLFVYSKLMAAKNKRALVK